MIQKMLDIENLIEKAETGYEAEITNVEKTTSDKMFGESKYEDRQGFKITLKIKEKGIDDGVEWNEWFNIPKPLGITESKLYRFKQKYGKLPKVGMKVNAKVIEGFFRCDL